METRGGLVAWETPRGKIFRILVHAGRAVYLDQRVTARSVDFVPQGTRGIVVGILDPYSGGRTDDIFRVRWNFGGRNVTTTTKADSFV